VCFDSVDSDFHNEVNVSLAFAYHLGSTPDVYLNELHLELQDTCGVLVLESTVWTTLVKGGYTMKKVLIMCFDPHFDIFCLSYLTLQSSEAL
jgi:hypothetical protein